MPRGTAGKILLLTGHAPGFETSRCWAFKNPAGERLDALVK